VTHTTLPQGFFAPAYWILIAPRFADEISDLGQSVLFTPPLVQFTSDYAPFLILGHAQMDLPFASVPLAPATQ
jgi:hypothetical protein